MTLVIWRRRRGRQHELDYKLKISLMLQSQIPDVIYNLWIGLPPGSMSEGPFVAGALELNTAA